MLDWVIGICLSMLGGAVIGLIPFYIGRYMGKPGLGKLGWTWCLVSGILFLSVPVAIGFLVAIFVRDRDYYPPGPSAVNQIPVTSRGFVGRSAGLGITCLSGPLKGRTYPINTCGMMIGRDHDCAVRFASDASGISRHHCSLRWQEGSLMLSDLNSAYGTYMADGRKLPPHYPVQVAAGSRFYLANTGYLFQIVITN